MTRERFLSLTIYALTTALGLLAFLYPFLLPAASAGEASSGQAPLLLALVVVLCLAVLIVEVQGQAVSAKHVALLGLLVALNSVLRFMDNAFPFVLGFSPIFFLIVTAGYVFGGRFGLLLGTLTLLVSALITGGVGPWLPFQMLAAGWVGLSAPLLRGPARWLGIGQGSRAEPWLLALLAGFWGLVYGAIINIWFWPFAVGDPSMFWEAGIGLRETLARYATFYLAPSLLVDLARAAGNVLMMLLLGQPTLKVLRRFHRRFVFQVQPLVQEPA